MTKKRIDELFFQLFCERNPDGTRHLRLKGNELIHRIGRRLTKGDMHELAKFLKKNQNVINLDLSYNDLTDDGLKILAEEFFNTKNNLKFLNLLHCDIQADGMKALSEASHLRLVNIRLAGNLLGADGAQFIGKLLEKCPCLEGLDIGQTDQILESIESLLMAIEKSHLKYLNISRIIPKSCYSQYNNSTLADDIGILLKLNTTLRELRAQKCELDGHDVATILGGLRIHTNLIMLDLSANRISDHGVLALAEWLRTRPNLMALRIASNRIGNIGARALAFNLSFSQLRLLDIHNNQIGDLGMSDILDSIVKTPELRMIFFWGNTLGKTSLTKIDRALRSGTLHQEYIDVKLYTVDGRISAAYYPTNQYTMNALCVLEHGIPQELKIVKNKEQNVNLPREMAGLHFITKYSAFEGDTRTKEGLGGG